MYAEAKINESEKEFLHTFYGSCADLYGVLPVRDAWAIYEECRKTSPYPSIGKTKFLKFSAIARREEGPFQIYEINEIFADEKPAQGMRFIVRRDIVGFGIDRFAELYDICDRQAEYHYFVPDDVCGFRDDDAAKAEQKLQEYLDDLVSSAETIPEGYSSQIPNPNRGKKLKDFSYVSGDDRFLIEYYSGGHYQKLADMKAAAASCPASRQILEKCRSRDMTGYFSVNKNIELLFRQLEEAGAEADPEEVMHLYQEFHNTLHMWCMRGWSPMSLHRIRKPSGPVQIQFGPGIEKMITEGQYDREEMVRLFEENGIIVSPESKYGK